MFLIYFQRLADKGEKTNYKPKNCDGGNCPNDVGIGGICNWPKAVGIPCE